MDLLIFQLAGVMAVSQKALPTTEGSISPLTQGSFCQKLYLL